MRVYPINVGCGKNWPTPLGVPTKEMNDPRIPLELYTVSGTGSGLVVVAVETTVVVAGGGEECDFDDGEDWVCRGIRTMDTTELDIGELTCWAEDLLGETVTEEVYVDNILVVATEVDIEVTVCGTKSVDGSKLPYENVLGLGFQRLSPVSKGVVPSG